MATAATNNIVNQQQGTTTTTTATTTAATFIRAADPRPPSNGNDTLQSPMQNKHSSPIQKTINSMPINNGNSTTDERASNDDLLGRLVAEDNQLISTNMTNDNESTCIVSDIKQTLESLLSRLEIEAQVQDEHPTIATNTPSQSSSLFVNEDVSFTGITSLVTTIGDDAGIEDEDESKPKDIVTLRNLELTPPPPPPPAPTQTSEMSTSKRQKRTRSETETDENESRSDEGRSKRQRKQTQLFQVGEIKTSRLSIRASRSSTSSSCSTPQPSASARKQSKQSSTKTSKKRIPKTPSPQPPPLPINIETTQIPPDVIFYEKDDYLAIRNEENSFYLCQLTENVRVQKPYIKIKWLDTKNNGKTYFLTSHFDKVPQKSIIMPVILNKLKSDKRGEQLFSLDEQVKENVMDRLRKSINFNSEQHDQHD